MSRRAVLIVVFSTACSTSAVTSTTAPTTSAPTTETTIPAPTTTNTTTEALNPPELPDPFDLAEEPLAGFEVDGFRLDDIDPDLVETVRVRLSVFGGLYSASVWDEFVSDDDEEVVAFSLYPSGSARGDPSLAMAVAEALAEGGDGFREASSRSVKGQTAYEVVDSTTTWLLWANNTHLFVTAGEDEAADDVMGAIIDEVLGSEYQWSEGDCLFFDEGLPYAPFGEGNLVSCGGPHEWEVIGSGPVPDGDFDGEALGDEVGGECEEAFFEFTGLLPIDSALNQVHYLPDEDEWQEGDRYYACIVSESEESGDARLIAGSLEGERSKVSRTTGDCYRRQIDVGTIECQDPHVFEYIGMADYPGDPDDDFPGGSDLTDALTEACDDLIAGYISERSVEGATVTPFPAGIGPFAWDRGVRSIPCFAYALEDARALEVVGSFSGGWGPLGDAEGAVEV